MKNIHLLPTDKKIKNVGDLVKDQYGDIHIFTKNDGKEYGKTTTKLNIYITSDEEIKEGDWCLKFPFRDEVFRCIEVKKNEYVKRKELHTYPYDWCKKIILTTDQDLIKDGIQPIDDEFLEWFVKNPSCERVEVSNNQYTIFNSEWKNFYKIIIPKEEPDYTALLKPVGTMQERMYSEEEVSDLLKCLRIELNINKELIDIDEWFNKLKK
jgi:hypothetical protein